MTGEDLFAALGDVDDRFVEKTPIKPVPPANRDETGEDIVFPVKRLRNILTGVVAAVCLVVGLCGGIFLGWLFSRPVDWGMNQQGGCVLEPPEHTHGEDLAPHIQLVLNGLDVCYALQDKLQLSDEDLTRFLTEKGYDVVGLTDRQQLERLMEILRNLPIPSCAGEAPREIYVDDRSTQAVFVFDDIYVEVQCLPSANTVAQKTQSLSRVPEYTRYPLYLGSVSEAGGVVGVHYVLNVSNHAVEVDIKAGSAEEALSVMDDLWFRYLNDVPRHGLYEQVSDESDHELVPQIHLNMDTRVFVASASIAHSYAENGSYVLENGRLTVTTQSTTFVFAVLDSETLLLLDDGDFRGWLKKGDLYKWVE